MTPAQLLLLLQGEASLMGAGKTKAAPADLPVSDADDLASFTGQL